MSPMPSTRFETVLPPVADEKPATLPLAGFDIKKAARGPLSDNDLFGARGATWPISSQARDANRALPRRISACDHQVSSRVARCPASAESFGNWRRWIA